MVKFDTETIKIIDLCQNLTRVHVKDCIIKENCAYFVVNNIKAGIGKDGVNVKRLEKVLRRRVKLFKWSENNEEFIRNLVPHIEKLEINEGVARIQVDSYFKAKIIGKGGRNIKVVREFLERLTPIRKLTVR